MSKDQSLARVRRLYNSAQPERDKCIQLLVGGFTYVDMGKTIRNQAFGNGLYHLFMVVIWGDGFKDVLYVQGLDQLHGIDEQCPGSGS